MLPSHSQGGSAIVANAFGKAVSVSSTGELDQGLREAFLVTCYQVCFNHRWHPVSVGRPLPRPLVRLCAGRPWAIVTAFNPGARRIPDAANRHRDCALLRCLRSLRPAALLRTRHVDPSRVWPDEAGWWFCPAPVIRTCRIARQFGQLGLVAGNASGAARLIEVGRCQTRGGVRH